MPETLSLFDPPEPEPQPELKLFLAGRLHQLASLNQLFIGASSWKYEGWLGQIYTRQRYLTQGRFSKKRFDQDCLTEYAETFPIVSGDFAFYQFPTRDFWRKLFAQIPPPFQFAFKVPEDLTLPAFPRHPRYAARAGRINDSFLSAELLEREFLDLLRPYASRVSLLIFEFPASAGRAFATVEDFAAALSRFLAALPKDFRYAVEIRDRQLLEPVYFRALREHGVAHLFNSWTDMPAIQEQASAAEAFTTNFTAVRGLLKPGRVYDESLRLFSPYDSVREPNAEVRSALRGLLIRAKKRAEPLFMFINNRLEGFAPGTIAAIVQDL